MKKIISLDLDGTLLNSEKKISEENIGALRDFKEQGGKIVFATARPKRVVTPLLPNFLLEDILICHNGGEIYINNEKVYNHFIIKNEVKRITKELLTAFPNRFIGVESEEVLFTNKKILNLFGEEPHTIVNFENFIFNDAPKILFEMKNVNREKVKEILGNDYKLVVSDKGILGQISRVGVNKLVGIKKVLKEFNLSLKDCIAFGDDYNDIEILEGVGIGVAMGNAEEDIKAIADYVTKTNDEHGVAYYINKEILKTSV